MIYFCADDYGISAESNRRIENCLKNGALNKVSVLPNGDIENFKKRLLENDAVLSLHINLVEGSPLSKAEDVQMLLSNDGYFKHSFPGLFLLSYSPKRKEFEKQLYKEIHSQIKFWKTAVGDDVPIKLDSHQHTHMIPLVFKTLMRVIEDENLNVEYLRIPKEPILPYISTPSLFCSYSLSGIVKQCILNFLSLVNLRNYNGKTEYFMGIMFSGNVNEKVIKKLLPKYMKLAEKNKRDIEIGFHPGYVENKENMLPGIRDGFKKFYFSPLRKVEYDTLINITKEGC